ncbi:hypothetical protein BHM03_00058050 [Ensete ventricosum]|uniref:Uncharacterized protein n=1 Tax=Ensete ventricosum TaxID=4639 RepID=A0A445MMI9_ENSVE|nr:hypothetical protein BHM03_00058050 [Ensete ventricosum]
MLPGDLPQGMRWCSDGSRAIMLMLPLELRRRAIDRQVSIMGTGLLSRPIYWGLRGYCFVLRGPIALGEDFAFLRVFRRGDEHVPLQRALGSSYCTPNIPAYRGVATRGYGTNLGSYACVTYESEGFPRITPRLSYRGPGKGGGSNLTIIASPWPLPKLPSEPSEKITHE